MVRIDKRPRLDKCNETENSSIPHAFFLKSLAPIGLAARPEIAGPSCLPATGAYRIPPPLIHYAFKVALAAAKLQLAAHLGMYSKRELLREASNTLENLIPNYPSEIHQSR